MAQYDISVIDTLEFDTNQCTRPCLKKLADGVLGICYEDGSNVVLKTYSYDGSYDNLTLIDSLTIGAYGFSAFLVLDSTHVVVAYYGPDEDGYAVTVSHDGSGDTLTTIETFEFDTVRCVPYRNSMIKFDSTHFGIVYNGTSGVCNFTTVYHDSNFQNMAVTDTLQISSGNTYQPSLCAISSTVFAVVYGDDAVLDNRDGYLKTFSHDGDGDNLTLVDTLEFDPSGSDYWQADVIAPDSTHLVIAERGPDNDGFAYTVSHNGSGASLTLIDTLEFDTSNNESSMLVDLYVGAFAVFYRGVDGDGFAKTISYDGSFDNMAVEDTLEFDTDNFSSPDAELIGGTKYVAVAYSGLDGDGYLKTFSIIGPPEEKTVTDTLSLSTAQIKAITRAVSDTLSLSTAISALRVLVKTVSDALSMSDSVVRAIGKVASSTLSMTTGVVRGISRSVSDALSLTASAVTARIRNAIVTDTLALTTSVTRAISRTVTETLSLTASAIKGLTRSVTDTLSLTVSVVSSRVRSKTVTDTVRTSSPLANYVLNGETLSLMWHKRVKPVTDWIKRIIP